MGHALTVTLTLETMTCHSCGTAFAVNSTLYRAYKEEGQALRCPNPRCDWASFIPTETPAQKLEKQLAAANQGRRWAEERLEAERREHSATKGKLAKLEKRASAGVCSCCNRTFQNLARHMKTKHSEKKEAASGNAG